MSQATEVVIIKAKRHQRQIATYTQTVNLPTLLTPPVSHNKKHSQLSLLSNCRMGLTHSIGAVLMSLRSLK